MKKLDQALLSCWGIELSEQLLLWRFKTRLWWEESWESSRCNIWTKQKSSLVTLGVELLLTVWWFTLQGWEVEREWEEDLIWWYKNIRIRCLELSPQDPMLAQGISLYIEHWTRVWDHSSETRAGSNFKPTPIRRVQEVIWFLEMFNLWQTSIDRRERNLKKEKKKEKSDPIIK